MSSFKIDKYEDLTIKEILPSSQSQIIQQTKFTYSPLGKSFEKSNQKNKDQEEKQKKKQFKSIENKLLSLIHLLQNMIFMVMIVKKIAHYFRKKKKYLINLLIKGRWNI